MFGNPSIFTRIAIGKLIGFIFGLIGMLILTFWIDEVSWLFRWGILFWYTTLGAIIGIFGVFTYHPILKMSLPWYFRGLLLGGWMNLVLTLFIYSDIEVMMLAMFGNNAILSSPYWLIAEGAIIGLLIEYLATRFGGEGKATVQ